MSPCVHLGLVYFGVKYLLPMFRVHVRRTDKLPEAVYHNIEEYMEHVSHSLYLLKIRWFNVMQITIIGLVVVCHASVHCSG